jgi:serine/threonine-protein kinase HipA
MSISNKPGEKPPPDALEVWLDDVTVGPIAHLGRLYREGAKAVRFEYDTEWLKRPNAFELDPELKLGAGSFYPKDSNFGVFLDSCPDRWGQVLMKRRELVEAKEEGRTKRELTYWNFFLGVQDLTRMGALRFSPLQTGAKGKPVPSPVFPEDDCLANEALSAPPVTRLAELQQVALELTRRKQDDLDLLKQWLRVLMAPGASLGGARPKANLSEQGVLWIAKFPAADDDYDWALREMLLHEMAVNYRLSTAPARVVQVGRGYHTFLTQRFDRVGGRRRFFTSAMALLGKTEKDEASYLNLAEFLSNNGAPGHIEEDLHELFRRVLFNVATGNRDDHLRNHGFIHQNNGWRMAPAYDMNPSSKKSEHVLTLDDASTAPDLTTVLGTAAFYRLTPAQAEADLAELCAIIATWESRAKRLGLSAEDRLELEGCFLASR